MTFEPNKDYVRQVLAEQVGYRADGLDIVDADGKVTKDTKAYQAIVNADGNYSQDVIDLHVERFGAEYRQQTDGEHPIDHRAVAGAGRNGRAR
jgi:hypothetical protein